MNSASRFCLFGLALLSSVTILAASAAPISSMPHARADGSYLMAGLFGESDEEKAERLQLMQHEQAQDSSIRYLRQRNDDLENTIRRLTGQIEDQDHRITELNTRIERMQKDFEYRLCRVVAAQFSNADQVPVPCGGTGSPALVPEVSNPAATSSSPLEGTHASGSPLQLPAPGGGATAVPSGAPDQAAAPPSANRAKFDAAMKLLAKTQYDEARSAFRSFADTYPKDELAAQAVYWFGDIAYVQKDYPAAARAFAEEIKKYPDSTRAPDSMLKLGQSLIAMGQKQEGCAALAALPTKYPTASQTVVARASDLRKTAKCK